ncbi:MAG: glycosyltransferase family 2 protein [Flavobacteriaceae bacterium]|jgi:glycosyltransferase involved in cell wall biosynthesis|nr:glycosyltransferase family 2 protein [Flavobacteriaceae bacterium]
MISILIPVYNYSIIELGKELINQGKKLRCPFEIIFLDDASHDKKTSIANQSFCETNRLTYLISKKNRGDAETRNHLADQAKYEWLLFIDADIMPVKDNFLIRYAEEIYLKRKWVYTNIIYKKEKPKEGILRWKYGVKYEITSTEERLKNPYSAFRLACFLIHRSLLEITPFPAQKESYGYTDLVFATGLKKQGVKPYYIENPVYHLGLENNEAYLEKVEKAMNHAASVITAKSDLASDIKAASLYLKMKRIHLDKVIGWVFQRIKPGIRKNLLSKTPNIRLLQLYKLGYLCEILARK